MRRVRVYYEHVTNTVRRTLPRGSGTDTESADGVRAITPAGRPVHRGELHPPVAYRGLPEVPDDQHAVPDRGRARCVGPRTVATMTRAARWRRKAGDRSHDGT